MKKLRTEAALKRVLEQWESVKIVKIKRGVMMFLVDDAAIGELSIKEDIKKRQPLTGVTKRLRKALRGK